MYIRINNRPQMFSVKRLEEFKPIIPSKSQFLAYMKELYTREGGNTEYKPLELCLTDEKFDKLVTEIKTKTNIKAEDILSFTVYKTAKYVLAHIIRDSTEHI